MRSTTPSEMTLRLELCVHDIAAALDFYQRVLGFQPSPQQVDGFTPLSNGAVQIALNRLAALPAEVPLILRGDLSRSDYRKVAARAQKGDNELERNWGRIEQYLPPEEIAP